MCLVLNCMDLLVCHAWWPCTAGADLWAVWSLIGGAACKSFNTTQILKDRRFVFVELWKKKYYLYWERLCCILRTDKRLGEMTWQLERGRRRVCWQPLAPTESAPRQDKAASDAKWAEYWVAQLALLTVLGNLRSQMSRGRPSGQGQSLFWFWFTLLGACVNRRLKDLCWCKGL